MVAACDLQPAPKSKASPAPGSAAGSAAPAAPTPRPVAPAGSAAPAGAVVDAGVPAQPPVDAMDVSERCLAVSEHVATVLIETVQDPAQKAAYVQDRARIVRRSAEACTRDAWKDEMVACLFAARTQQAVQDCARPKAAGSASGSAADKR